MLAPEVVKAVRAAWRLGHAADVRMNAARGYTVFIKGDMVGHISAEDFAALCVDVPLACHGCCAPLHRGDDLEEKILAHNVVEFGANGEPKHRTKRSHFNCLDAMLPQQRAGGLLPEPDQTVYGGVTIGHSGVRYK